MCGVHQLSVLCPRHGTDRHTTESRYAAQRIPVGQCHCCCVVQSCHQIQRYQHRTTTHASTCRGDPRVIVSWSIMSSTRHMQVLILVLVLVPPLQQHEQRSSSACTPVLALTCEVVCPRKLAQQATTLPVEPQLLCCHSCCMFVWIQFAKLQIRPHHKPAAIYTLSYEPATYSGCASAIVFTTC